MSGGCCDATKQFTQDMWSNDAGPKPLALDDHELTLLAREDINSFVPRTTGSLHEIPSLDQAICHPCFKLSR